MSAIDVWYEAQTETYVIKCVHRKTKVSQEWLLSSWLTLESMVKDHCEECMNNWPKSEHHNFYVNSKKAVDKEAEKMTAFVSDIDKMQTQLEVQLKHVQALQKSWEEKVKYYEKVDAQYGSWKKNKYIVSDHGSFKPGGHIIGSHYDSYGAHYGRPPIDSMPGLKEMVKHPVLPYHDSLEIVIISLNDHHGWTREQIADWLETLDIDLTFKTPEPRSMNILD